MAAAAAMPLIQESDLVGFSILAPGELAASQAQIAELRRIDIRLLAPRKVQLMGPDQPNGPAPRAPICYFE